jgi:tRNA modification GTPase
VLELHVHGGPAVVKAVLAAIPRCSTTRSAIRYAEPGEFTHRAFLNGRLDLTQVEALGDALSAETEQQRRMSMRATGGALARLYEEWRTLLLYARGELEALIDFSEDQHFDESPAELCVSIANQVEALIRRLEIHCQNAVRGEMLRNGISISLLGAPNAGKSSLLNRVIGREAAIVSHEAGTTRDIVEVGLDLGGFYCRLGDTAGLRQHGRSAERMPDMDPSAAAANTESPISQIEQEGMRRAKERATQSDVVIVVLSFECLRDGTDDGRIVLHLDNEVCSTAAQLFDEKNNVIVLINKADLLMPDGRHIALDDAIKSTLQAIPGLPKEAIHFISCQEASSSVNAGGIQEFLGALIQHFVRLTAAASPTMTDSSGPVDNSVWQESLGATERHRMLLQSCLEHLQAFILQVRGDSEPAIDVLANRLPIAASAHPGHIGGTTAIVSDAEAEMDIVASAEYLRAAADCLGRITGRGTSGDVEDVLGVVFEKFCVGK